MGGFTKSHDFSLITNCNGSHEKNCNTSAHIPRDILSNIQVKKLSNHPIAEVSCACEGEDSHNTLGPSVLSLRRMPLAMSKTAIVFITSYNYTVL